MNENFYYFIYAGNGVRKSNPFFATKQEAIELADWLRIKFQIQVAVIADFDSGEILLW